ncbi:hypothetical protein [Aquirufa salirivi]|uniref:Uncharacterized protein n=1 Tax=Aquirufa salirivi TaxID=3104729 RepID=A0ABW8RXC9_9BACT
MKNILNESQTNNLDTFISKENRKIWISPQLVHWITDQLENAKGVGADGGAKTYGDV